jgi:hypothetical protein
MFQSDTKATPFDRLCEARDYPPIRRLLERSQVPPPNITARRFLSARAHRFIKGGLRSAPCAVLFTRCRARLLKGLRPSARTRALPPGFGSPASGPPKKVASNLANPGPQTVSFAPSLSSFRYRSGHATRTKIDAEHTGPPKSGGQSGLEFSE